MSAPTLFVGLGGTGAKIVGMLEKENRGRTSQKIGYAVFDTDANELKDLRNKGYTGALIQTAQNLTVGEYLDVDPEAARKWFPVIRVLSRKTLTEGAGQVRAISRLAFEACVRSGHMEPLHRELENLYQIDSDDLDQSLRIVIVSSAAGGTGSGLILPVAMYIRKYLASAYEQYSAIIRGFFLMPEIFDKVNSDQSERKSLATNAYATMKELDAFMKKGDGFLPDRYEKKLVFPIPRAGSNEYDYSDAMPYDYCFLFDKRSNTNSVLATFDDYKRQAAICLQGLCVELTAKRNNSSEDNVIKELVEGREQGSCNRYCGVGAANLVYPYEDIVAYIAEYWKEASLNETWLRYDLAHARKRKERKMREVALAEADREELSLASTYMEMIGDEENKQDLLADVIRKQCGYKPKSSKLPGNWVLYAGAVENAIEDLYSRIEGISRLKEEFDRNVGIVDSEANFDTVYALEQSARAYETNAMQYLYEGSQNLFYQMCYEESDNEECIWHWVKSEDEDEKGFHPNGTRYFLYQAEKSLQFAYEGAQQEINDFEKYLDSADYKEDLDLADTKDEIETRKTIADYIDRVKRRHRDDAARQISQYYETFGSWLERNYIALLKKRLYERILEFVHQFITSYEKYYENLTQATGKNQIVRDDIRKRLNRRNGSTIRLVSSTETCLDEIRKKTERNGVSTEVPGALCNSIYHQLHDLTVNRMMGEEEKKLTAQLGEIYQATVNDFWLNYVKQQVAGLIDVDVIDAIMNEAEWENDIYDYEGKLKYLRSVLKEMGLLSVPFLTKTTGGEQRIIYSCSYNRALEEKQEAGVRAIIESELKDRGGESSADADKYKITFTQAMYGLSLNDIGKFAPIHFSYVYGKQEGTYYTSYSEAVSRIHPNMAKTSYITPHLDRNWHYLTSLPEINAEEQQRLELRIGCALVYGLVFRRFVYEKRTQYANVYKYRLNFRGKDDELVSNDELCDQFPELLIALVKNTMTVDDILEYSHNKIRSTIDSVRKLDDSYLVRNLKKFTLDEIDMLMRQQEEARKKASNEEETAASDEGVVRSIFEIPLIYARTAPMSEYDEVFAETLIQAAIKVLEETVNEYHEGDDAAFQLCTLIKSQYKLYLKNLRSLKKAWVGIDNSEINSKIRIALSEKVEELGDAETAAEIRDTITDKAYLDSLDD